MLFMEISTHFKHFFRHFTMYSHSTWWMAVFLKNAKYVSSFNVCEHLSGFMFQKKVVILQPKFNGELQKSLSIQDKKRQ